MLIIVYSWVTRNYALWRKLQTIGPWDQLAYYSYLPATFIHHDFTFQKLAGTPFYPVMHLPGPKGLPVLNMVCGVALLQLPFFGLAHLHCYFASIPTTGFTWPYHFWVQVGNLFYVFAGFYYLRKVLLRYFNEFSTGLTLLLIGLATQLFYYSTSEPLMSHAYSFALIAIFLHQIPIWYTTPSCKNSLLLGSVVGLLLIVRPTNILIIIPLVFYKAYSWKDILANLSFFMSYRKSLFALTLGIIIPLLPQLVYWKMIAGSWLYNSYTSINPFYFLQPHIYQLLFSYRKGLLIYTPIMAFAYLGFYKLIKKQNPMGIGSLIYVIAMIYVLSSWWCWWYGGSFGLRAMIDTFSISALGLAAFIQKFSQYKKLILGLALIFVAFYQFQNFQYRRGVIHYDSMTRQAYWAIFLKLSPPPNYYDTMLSAPDYEKARKGIPEYAE